MRFSIHKDMSWCFICVTFLLLSGGSSLESRVSKSVRMCSLLLVLSYSLALVPSCSPSASSFTTVLSCSLALLFSGFLARLLSSSLALLLSCSRVLLLSSSRALLFSCSLVFLLSESLVLLLRFPLLSFFVARLRSRLLFISDFASLPSPYPT